MILDRCFDKDIVDSILLDKDIFKTISEDHIKPIKHQFDLDKDAYVSVVVDNEIIGIYIFSLINSVTADAHAHILPRFRKEHSLTSGKESLKWLINNTKCEKVIATVPVCYGNVKQFLLKSGFVVEGINRKSYKKDGNIIDMTMLGITKEEIEVLL